MANDKKTLELQIKIAASEAFAAVESLKGEMQNLSGAFKSFSEVDSTAIQGTFHNTRAAAEQAAASFKLFGANSNELRQVQAQLKAAVVDLVTKGIDPQSEEVQKLVEEYKRLDQAAGELDKATGQNIDSFGQLKNALTSLAEVAAFTKVLGTIQDMGAFALSTADTFQKARNEFGILLGDMEAGAGLFNQIKAFNDKTPFDLSTLTQATNVLIAAKVPLADLEAQLTKFGDLSQGNSQRLTSYIHAFSTAAAKGKADMQVLNTYLNQGVPILDALAKNFGVTTAEVIEMSSQGEISFQDFSAALDDLTAAGGRYFGGMELASQSLSAMQEGLNEAVNSLAASFGEMLMPAAIGVVGILTDMANAINESPLLKGLLAGALITIAGLLGAMAVKAAIAFAQQMALNFAIGALNPVVLTATIAVAAMAAGYVAYSSKAQAAKRDTDALALSARSGASALNDMAAAAHNYANAFNGMSGRDIALSFQDSERAINSLERMIQQKQAQLDELNRRYANAMRNTGQVQQRKGLEEALADLNQRLEAARAELEAKRQGLEEMENLRLPAPTITIDDSAAKAAAAWIRQWREQWEKFQGEELGNPFTGIDMEHTKKLGEAAQHGAGREIIDQINEYYRVKRTEIADKLKEDEERRMIELSRTNIDNLEYELRKEIEAIDLLEKQRVFAAGESEEEIAAIRERFAEMRQEMTENYEADIARTRFEEVKAAVVDWRQTLSDSLTQGLLDMKMFSDEAAVILGNLSAQFLELSASSALTGFEEFGRALGEGKDAAESLQQALAAMAQQILKQLPMMFLQAGLQLIANGQWALGLGFIAAAGSSAFISGYVDGKISKEQEGASANAHGNIYDEYGKAARAFADGGMFTNQVVNTPTYFRHGGGLGLMGEAGPEAIMPLTRMPNGDLGVQTAGDTQVVVNIINKSGEDVQQEETTDADGNKQIDVIIGGMMNQHIASGKADRALGARYGLRAVGV